MRILIDGKNLSLKTGTGIATYARNLCALARQGGHHVDVLFGEAFGYSKNPLLREIGFYDTDILTGPKSALQKFRESAKRDFTARPFEIPLEGKVVTRQFSSRLPRANRYFNASNVFLNADLAFQRRLWLMRRFNRVENRTGSDVAHWTYPIPLTLEGAANIYTIHDLVPLRLPYTTLDRKRTYYQMIDLICRTADKIVTVSETSRNDILNLFDVAPEKVVNTYQSVSIPPALLDVPLQQVDEELLGLHGVRYKGYILYYGAIEPKKNVNRLIEAYLSSPIEVPLLIVGKDGWLNDNELNLINPPFGQAAHAARYDAVGQRVVRVDYVSFPQLVNLIRGAKAVAAPSLYEGFGLPVLEAMLCGTAALTSNVAASAEIAGDAAVLVDPYNVRDIRDGLIRLMDDGLNAEMVARGEQRAKDFGEDRYAERIAALYASLERRGGR